MKYLLMIPGPVETPDEVINEYSGQTIAHYGNDFRDLYIETGKKLSRILGSEKALSLIIPGSGTVALESIGTSLCNRKKVLVINNGNFGQRLFEIARQYSDEVDHIILEPAKEIDFLKIKQGLKKKYDIVLMVHVETSTGMLNPIKDIAPIVKNSGAIFAIDSIASSGIEELEMDKWGIDVVASTSQKGFSCPAGLGMVTINKNTLEDLKVSKDSKGFYTNLKVWVNFYYDSYEHHPYPVTIPTNLVKGLNKSLEIIETEGIKERQLFFKKISEKIIVSLKVLGLDTLVPKEFCANGLTGVYNCNKFHAQELIDFLKNKLSIQVGGALSDLLAPVFFRIGHMSIKQCETRNLASVITGIGVFMKQKGIKINLEDAIELLI